MAVQRWEFTVDVAYQPFNLIIISIFDLELGTHDFNDNYEVRLDRAGVQGTFQPMVSSAGKWVFTPGFVDQVPGSGVVFDLVIQSTVKNIAPFKIFSFTSQSAANQCLDVDGDTLLYRFKSRPDTTDVVLQITKGDDEFTGPNLPNGAFHEFNDAGSNTIFNNSPDSHTESPTPNTNPIKVEILTLVGATPCKTPPFNAFLDFQPIVVNLVKTDPTTLGGSEGTITTTVSGGSGDFTFLWDDGPTTQDRTGLVEATYGVTVTDVLTGLTEFQSTTLLDPDIEPDNTVFFVPVLNGFSFVRATSLDYLKDHFFITEAEELIGFSQVGYCQKVILGEVRSIQFQSNFDNNVVEVLDDGGGVVDTPSVDLVFNPTPGDFDIFQSDITFGTAGVFQVRITVDDGAGGSVTETSELIEVKAVWDNTYLIEFFNGENDENLYFADGFTANLRVEAHLYKRTPSSTRTVFRGSDGHGSVLSSRTQRKLIFETKDLPPYLHEQLAIGCSLDTVLLRGDAYFSEEGYNEPEYRSSLYMLSNSSVVLEVKTGFDNPTEEDIVIGNFKLITEDNDPIVTENGDNIVHIQ